MAECQVCYGRGLVMLMQPTDLPTVIKPGDVPPAHCPPQPRQWRPCPRCYGSGHQHCCEGEQPSVKDEEEK